MAFTLIQSKSDQTPHQLFAVSGVHSKPNESDSKTGGRSWQNMAPGPVPNTAQSPVQIRRRKKWKEKET